VSYVHRYEVDNDPMHKGVKALDYIKADGNVVFEIEKMPFGLSLFGRRMGEPDSYYWRVTQWLFPWFTLIAPFGDHALGGHVWVPIDDYSCWAWSINWQPSRPLNAEEVAPWTRAWAFMWSTNRQAALCPNPTAITIT